MERRKRYAKDMRHDESIRIEQIVEQEVMIVDKERPDQDRELKEQECATNNQDESEHEEGITYDLLDEIENEREIEEDEGRNIQCDGRKENEQTRWMEPSALKFQDDEFIY
jgi:hypothetical protein